MNNVRNLECLWFLRVCNILKKFKNMYSLFGSPLVADGKKEDREKKRPLLTIVLQSTEDFYKPY